MEVARHRLVAVVLELAPVGEAQLVDVAFALHDPAATGEQRGERHDAQAVLPLRGLAHRRGRVAAALGVELLAVLGAPLAVVQTPDVVVLAGARGGRGHADVAAQLDPLQEPVGVHLPVADLFSRPGGQERQRVLRLVRRLGHGLVDRGARDPHGQGRAQELLRGALDGGAGAVGVLVERCEPLDDVRGQLARVVDPVGGLAGQDPLDAANRRPREPHTVREGDPRLVGLCRLLAPPGQPRRHVPQDVTEGPVSRPGGLLSRVRRVYGLQGVEQRIRHSVTSSGSASSTTSGIRAPV